MADTAIRTGTFIDSLGVNTHMAYTDTPYVSETNVASDLAYLGISNIRDEVPNADNGTAAQTSLEALAKAGIKEDLFIGNTETTLPPDLTQLNALEAANPGSIDAVEGPNEINNAPVTYNGLTGQDAATAMQADIYSMVKSDSALNTASVFDFTGSTAAIATPSGTLTAQADGSYQLVNGISGWRVTLPTGTSTLTVDYTGAAPSTGLFGYPGTQQVTGMTQGANGTATFTYDNTSGAPLQTYLSVAAWSQTTGITGVSAVSGGSGNLVTFEEVSTRPGHSDYANIHPYPNNGDEPNALIKDDYNYAYGTTTPGATVITEDGYDTDPNDPNGVSQISQARGDTDMLLDGYANGASQTFLYELVDEFSDTGNTNSQDHFGLFNNDNSAKPVATAIHDLTTILADSGATAATFAPGKLDWSSTDLPATANTLLMEKSNGAYDLAVWNENGLTSTSTSTVNIALGGTYDTVKIFDPITGTAAISTLSNVSSVSLTLGADPLIVEVEPNAAAAAATETPAATTATPAATPAATTPAAADPVTFQVSEDAYQGNAQYTVKVDGKQVGGIYTATASHAAGASQSVSLAGNFGSGAHTVAIDFLNDLYGGTPQTDRNLYVQNVAIDDQPMAAALNFYSAGTQTVSGSDGPPGTITMKVSEDAYQGNAQYVVDVDGVQVGGIRTATASHAAGDSQTVTLNSDYAYGTHKVSIDFLNDAYAGTPATDRNLYVHIVSLDGQATGGTMTLDSNGTQTMSISDTAPVTTSATTATSAAKMSLLAATPKTSSTAAATPAASVGTQSDASTILQGMATKVSTVATMAAASGTTEHDLHGALLSTIIASTVPHSLASLVTAHH